MSVREGQTRIRNIAKTLSDDEKLSDLDKEFLINALQNIANGNDAEKELGVKAKKGERKSRHTRVAKINSTLVNGWLATAIAPVNEGGLGLTLKKAVSLIKAEWPNLPSEQSICRKWNDFRKTQGRDFKIKTD